METTIRVALGFLLLGLGCGIAAFFASTPTCTLVASPQASPGVISSIRFYWFGIAYLPDGGVNTCYVDLGLLGLISSLSFIFGASLFVTRVINRRENRS